MENDFNSLKGLVFDIEEFAVFDGPGIRCAVFMKGCPLRCKWCHNPEGLGCYPQRVVTQSLCVHCGTCKKVCPSPDRCIACGTCVRSCPRGCIRIAGTEMTCEEVAAKIRKQAKILALNGGGVTFSGGEVMLQSDFIIGVRKLIPDVHALIETSGFASEKTFRSLAESMDMVIMDIKIVNSELHRKWCGVDNTPILRNLKILKSMNKVFRIRIPLIPTVNDTLENMEETAQLLENAPALEKVELMRYNKAAGAKYIGVDMKYEPGFPEDIEPRIYTEPFEKRGIRVEIL